MLNCFCTCPPPFAIIIAEADNVPATAGAAGPKVKLLVPILSLPEVKVSVPLTVTLPVVLNPPELFNLRLPSVTPEMVAPLPVMLIAPVPVCVPAPFKFPARVIVTPLSFNEDPEVKVRLPGMLTVPAETTVLVPLLLLLVRPPLYVPLTIVCPPVVA